MKRGFAALVVACLVGTAAAAPDAAPAEVTITADRFVVEDAKRIATFTGDVVAIRGTLTVRAPAMVVTYGPGGAGDIASFVASGGVRIETPGQVATGEQAVYDPKAQTLRVAGNVLVVGDKSRVDSGDLLFDLKADTAHFTADAKGRVTGVFRTQ